MGGGPKTETKSQSTNVNRPLQEAQPLVNRFINGIGGLYGGGGAAGGDVLTGGGGTGTLYGGAANDALVAAGKRIPPGMSAGGSGFDFGLTGTESSALDAMAANAAKNNPYAPGIGLLAKELLAGGTDRTGMVNQAYDQFHKDLSPYTSMSTDPYGNPAFTKVAADLTNDAVDRVKSSYAGAGYSPAGVGTFGQDVGEGIARGFAPTWLQAYNDLEARKGSAIRDMLAAGTSTAGLLQGMDETALGNRQAGVGVAGAALAAEDYPYAKALEIEAQRRGIPIKNATQLASLIVPMAQLGSTTNQNSTSETQMHTPPIQQIMGAGMMGAGLLSGMGVFGPAAAAVPAATGFAGAPMNLASFRSPAWGGTWGDPSRPGSIY